MVVFMNTDDDEANIPSFVVRNFNSITLQAMQSLYRKKHDTARWISLRWTGDDRPLVTHQTPHG